VQTEEKLVPAFEFASGSLQMELYIEDDWVDGPPGSGKTPLDVEPLPQALSTAAMSARATTRDLVENKTHRLFKKPGDLQKGCDKTRRQFRTRKNSPGSCIIGRC
jgi:hypothetical protein